MRGFAFGVWAATLCACLAAPCPTTAQSNLGTRFALALPQNEIAEKDDDLQVMLFAPRPTTAFIGIGQQTPFKIFIPADSIVVVKGLPRLGNFNDGVVGTACMMIVSNDSIAVVGAVFGDEPEVTGVPPISQCGTHFVFPSGTTGRRIVIVSTSDSTQITLKHGGVQEPGSTMLEQGQTFSLFDAYTNLERELSASRPVAVFEERATHEKKAYDDLMPLEFLFPVDALGTRFYFLPSKIFSQIDSVQCSSVQDPTYVVFGNSDTQYVSPNWGNARGLPRPTVITATAPVMLQNLSTVGPASLVHVPAVSQYGRDVLFCCASQGWVTIVHPLWDTASIRLNGAPLAGAQWTPFDEFMAGTEIPVQHGVYHLTSSQPMGVCVRWYAFGVYNPSFGSTTGRARIVAPSFSVHLQGCTVSADTTLPITNFGEDTLRVSGMRIVGPDSAAFSVTTVPGDLPPAIGVKPQWAAIGIRFVAPRAGTLHATLLIASNDSTQSPLAVALTGVRDSVGVVADPPSLDFGTMMSCDSYRFAKVRLVNTGNVSATLVDVRSFDGPFILSTAAPSILKAGQDDTMIVACGAATDSVYRVNATIVWQCDTLTIPLRLRVASPRVADRTLDFGTLCPGSATAQRSTFVVNPADSPWTVASFNVRPPFAIDSPAAGFVVPPHDSVLVVASFHPVADGQATQTARLAGVRCSASVQLVGEQGTPHLTSADAVTFDDLCLGDSATRSITVINSGNVTATLTAATTTNGFAVTTPLPLSIPAGGSQSLDVRFVPAAPGASATQIVMQAMPCGIAVQTTASGACVSVGMAAQNVDAGTLLVGTEHDTSLAISNIGTTAMTIDTVMLVSGSGAFVIDTARFVLQPSANRLLAARFVPMRPGPDTAWLCLRSRVPCHDSVCVMITGSAFVDPTPTVHLCTDVIPQTLVGDSVVVTVNLLDSLPAKPLDSVRLELMYNPAMLGFLHGNSTVCPATFRRLAAGRIEVSLAPCGAVPVGALCRMTFLGMVTARDTARDSIVIGSVFFMPRIADGQGCATPVTVVPPCGLHGVAFGAAEALGQNYPNPASTSTTFTVDVPADLRAASSLNLYDPYGQCVRSLTRQLRGASGDGPTIDLATDDLPSGTYVCVLEVSGTRVMRLVQIVH